MFFCLKIRDNLCESVCAINEFQRFKRAKNAYYPPFFRMSKNKIARNI